MTRTTRTITVVIESRNTAFVSGYGTREVLTELRGRPPLWSRQAKAWATTEDTAMDVVAYAERRNWNIVLTANAKAATTIHAAWARPPQPEQPDPGAGLW